MKKFIFKIIHFVGLSKYWSYSDLEKWGVEDIWQNEIIWKK